jgi:hypothetical protein
MKTKIMYKFFISMPSMSIKYKNTDKKTNQLTLIFFPYKEISFEEIE